MPESVAEKIARGLREGAPEVLEAAERLVAAIDAAGERNPVAFEGPFTLDEVALIEAVSGVPLPKWFDGTTPEGALRRAILFVVAMRDEPITLAVAGKFGGTIEELRA